MGAGETASDVRRDGGGSGGGQSVDAVQPLLFATFYQRNDEVRRILKTVPVNSVNRAQWTPLCTAAWRGNSSTVCILIDEFGADLETANEFGWTPLLAAAMQ